MRVHVVRWRIIYLAITVTWLLAGCEPVLLVDQRPDSHALVLKIITNQAGIYAIDARSLQAWGISFQAMVDGGYLLTRNELRWPSWLANDPQRLVFYAPGSDSPYSLEEVFLLEFGGKNGRSPIDPPPENYSMVAERELTSAQAGSPQENYIETTRWENNEIYRPQVTDGDHWMWQMLAAPGASTLEISASDVTATTTPDIPQAAGGGPSTIENAVPFLRVGLWAATEADQNPDHIIKLLLNKEPLGEYFFEGQGQWIVETKVPSGILRSGINTLGIELPGSTGAPADLVGLDWIELSYARRLVAQKDRLTFTGVGLPVQFLDFSGPVDIFELSENNQAIWVVHGLVPGTVWASQKDRSYLVLGPGGGKTPLRIEPAQMEPDLRQQAQRGYSGADYLILGPAQYADVLAPLLTLRRSQGLQTQFIPLQAVYDQFNGGMPEPQGIRNFLQYAVQSWQPAPRYLLLVGDATYDPRGYLSTPQANQLPVFLIQTEYGGQTGSDYGYAMLAGATWPSGEQGGQILGKNSVPLALAVGRLPARQAEEVQTWVEKVLTYEANLDGPASQRNVLAVADGSNEQFILAAQSFLDWFPDASSKELITSLEQEAAQQLQMALQNGAWVVGYFGHGSATAWAKEQVLSVEGVSDLESVPQFPIYIQMTCLTGLFIHPEARSLTDALLWEKGGAAAALAPTSLTLPLDQHLLAQAVTHNLLDAQHTRLGDVFRSALQELPADDPGIQQVAYTFLLFGDPALSLPAR